MGVVAKLKCPACTKITAHARLNINLMCHFFTGFKWRFTHHKVCTYKSNTNGSLKLKQHKAQCFLRLDLKHHRNPNVTLPALGL